MSHLQSSISFTPSLPLSISVYCVIICWLMKEVWGFHCMTSHCRFSRCHLCMKTLKLILKLTTFVIELCDYFWDYFYVCMYVCMYVFVCMYICMYVCMYVCAYISAYVCMNVCMMYVCVPVCMYLCMDGWIDGWIDGWLSFSLCSFILFSMLLLSNPFNSLHNCM